MVPNIANGTSFMGAGLYYLHDKREEGELVRLTTERVEWVHTHNLVAEDPDLALREMATTAARQNQLKEQAGRGQGSYVEETVKTISLSWEPGEHIDKDKKIEAAEGFLKYMGWSGHQAIFVCHNDTEHEHVHIILNKIDPETGLKLNEWQDEKRSQRWALEYEKEQGLIRCRDRAAVHEQGADIPPCGVPRPVYNQWQRNAIDLEELLDFQRRQDASEWDMLKQVQRDERDEYWAETKKLIRSTRAEIYRDVKEEFREQWAEFYKEDAQHRGDPSWEAHQREFIKETRLAQSEELDHRQHLAVQKLLQDRADAYDELKERHREERLDLHRDQADGITRYDLLNQAYPVPAMGPITKADPVPGLHVAAQEVVQPPQAQETRSMALDDEARPAPAGGLGEDRGPSRDPLLGIVGGLLGIADGLADSLSGSSPAPRDPFADIRAAQRAQDELDAIIARNQEQAREAAREQERERERERSNDRER